ncbi:hypothetical protein C8A05DRAFT_29989 [Staphylotrichum tortipilum]|uniref:Uncharacterized protein n=1 Tax=Staphylotrichum tortipilum TaxID=2831512 RepID=A0AAN6RX76_9PEZI|nr:hypothetical protein C8A05DRAFT_29989 [Staphylotrichum longicolle]
MPCHYYPPADLDDLEEEAESATPQQQRAALQIIGDIFNGTGLAYALMGGMNFFLRGSGRATQDVDLAVSGTVQLAAILDMLNNDERITRPANRMSWLSGVARIFVRIGTQQVQIDLKWQRAEGHGMPANLATASEGIQIIANQTAVRFLSIGPLVKAKFQSYGRGFEGDFTDLFFVCTHATYGGRVRQIADDIPIGKREALLEETIDNHPNDEDAVRYALKLEETSGSESSGSGKGTKRSPGGGAGGGGGGGGGNGTKTTKTATATSRTTQQSSSTGSRTSTTTGSSTMSTASRTTAGSGVSTRPSATSSSSASLTSGMKRLAVADTKTASPSSRTTQPTSRSSASTATAQSSATKTSRTVVSGKTQR